ncbi:MAG: Maf family protein [Streptococcaceae bacterium]|nr:Maf family protein [Streptococcaceae bacterium]
MIILASNSPRRKELLKRIIPDYQVIPADIDESVYENEKATIYAKRMSETKAAFIHQTYSEDLVIAADTIVSVGDKILGKPENAEDARVMLLSYSGKSHQVMTSVTIMYKERKKSFMEVADVEFYEMTEAEITQYLSTNEWQDKAGGYGIQGAASLYVKGIMGDFFTIVGFPIARIYHEIQEFLAVYQAKSNE